MKDPRADYIGLVLSIVIAIVICSVIFIVKP